jgi:hypothetical protein
VAAGGGGIFDDQMGALSIDTNSKSATRLGDA